MGVSCRPVEANVNTCGQTGLRGADRREMASTCCIAGPLLPSSPQLHDTHINLHTCVCVCPCPLPSALSWALWRHRGMDALSSPCPSSPDFRSCCLVPPFSLLVFSIYLSLTISCAAVFSFIASFCKHMLSPHPPYLSQVVFQPPKVWRWSPCSEERLLPPAFSLSVSCPCYLLLSKLNS